MHDQPVFGEINRGKQRFHVIEKRREGDAADQLEQKIAERHAPRLGRRVQRVQHRHHAAAQVRSEHQRQRDMNADDLRRRERCREQHDGEAGIRQDREHCADEHVEQQVARGLVITYITDITTTQYQVIQIEYTINREFSGITPGHEVYCFESVGQQGQQTSTQSSSQPARRVLIQLLSATRLLFEAQTGSCRSPFALISPTTYSR